MAGTAARKPDLLYCWHLVTDASRHYTNTSCRCDYGWPPLRRVWCAASCRKAQTCSRCGQTHFMYRDADIKITVAM